MKQSIRGSDVFIKEDVRSVLQALLATNETLAQMQTMQTPDIQNYRYGYAAAVAAVATAFDIKLERPEVYP